MDESSGWAAAAELAAGGRSATGGRTPRRTVVILVVVGVILLVVIAAGILFGGALDDVAPIRRSPDWTVWVALSLLAVAGALIVGAVVSAGRGSSSRTNQRILSPLTHAERASAWRQLAGREPVEPEHLPTLRAAADQLDRVGRPELAVQTAIGLVVIASALTARTWVIVGLAVLLLAASIPMLVLGLRRYLIARAFLRRSTAERSAS